MALKPQYAAIIQECVKDLTNVKAPIESYIEALEAAIEELRELLNAAQDDQKSKGE